MSGRKRNTTPIGLGFRAVQGGSVVVGVALEAGEPPVVRSSFLATAAEGDRIAAEPYHVAAESHRNALDKAAAVVAEGRKRQDQFTAGAEADLLRTLIESSHAPIAGALLVNRSAWILDDLTHCLSYPEHVRIAEELAVRNALRFAFGQHGVQAVEMDEKTLPAMAAKDLGRPAAAIGERLDALGASGGRPWRKEQKLTCLAAWVAVAALRRS